MKLIFTFLIAISLSGCSNYYRYYEVQFSDKEQAVKAARSSLRDATSLIKKQESPTVDSELVIDIPSHAGMRTIINLINNHKALNLDVFDYLIRTDDLSVKAVARAAEMSGIFASTKLAENSSYTNASQYKHDGTWKLLHTWNEIIRAPRWLLINPDGEDYVMGSLSTMWGNDETKFQQFVEELRRFATRGTLVYKASVGELTSDSIDEPQFVIEAPKSGPKIDASQEPKVVESFAPKTVKGNGKWTISVDEDPITDAKKVSALLRSNDYAETRSGKTFLVIRCYLNDIEAYVSFDDYMTDSAVVDSRIDKQTPEKLVWQSSTDKTAVFYPRNAKLLLRSLFSADRFVVRATPYNESPKTLIFDVKGLHNAIYQHGDACKW